MRIFLLEKLRKLKVNKSPGPDGMHPRVLHDIADGIKIPLAIIYNTSVRQKTLPQEWKNANVSVIYKKGKKPSHKITDRSV